MTVLVYFMLLKITEKVLLDCNTMYSFTVYRIHSYYYCSLLLLLFKMYTITIYTIIVTVIVTILFQ